MRALLAIAILGLFISCNRSPSNTVPTLGGHATSGLDFLEGQEVSDYISGWDLAVLYNTEGSKDTGYWKSLNDENYVFPGVWDRHDNTSGDPTENEPYIQLPTGKISAIILDELDFTSYPNPVVAVRIIWTNSTELMLICTLSQNLSIEEVFRVSSNGQINLQNIGKDNVQIQNDEPMGNGIRRTQHNFDGKKFVSISPVILDKKVLSGYLGTQPSQSQTPSARLKGPWVFVENAPESLFTPSDLHKDRVIVNFMPENREVIFSRNDMAEIFTWRSTTPLLTGILISLQNSFVQQITQSAIVQFIGRDRILMRFQGDMIWTGVYRKMSREERNHSVEEQNMILQTYGTELAGSYRSADGQEFFFNYPNLTISYTDGRPEEKGMYAILKVNKQDILEAKTVDQNGRLRNRYVYQFSNSERREGGRLIRSFVITPGDLHVFGMVSNRVDSMTFEQITNTEGNP
ncbi:MAG: hypothetical protein ACRCVN_04570 [Spirochaetia bacterium]